MSLEQLRAAERAVDLAKHHHEQLNAVLEQNSKLRRIVREMLVTLETISFSANITVKESDKLERVVQLARVVEVMPPAAPLASEQYLEQIRVQAVIDWLNGHMDATQVEQRAISHRVNEAFDVNARQYIRRQIHILNSQLAKLRT